MPVDIITGNIFTSSCQTLVNTVNCVGVMGAGIALECRLRYPEMYEKYLQLCKNGYLDVGLLWLYKGPERWILNFPTKKNWKQPSRETYLHIGLQKFVDTYAERGINSIAFPLLGADKGGIPKKVSQEIMLEYLADIDIPVEIYHYDARARDEVFLRFRRWLEETGPDEAGKLTGIRKPQMRALLAGVRNDKVRQVNQLLGIQGIGIATVEKVFRTAMDSDTDLPGLGSMSLFD